MITAETLTTRYHGVDMLLYAQIIKFIGVTYFIFFIRQKEPSILFDAIIVSAIASYVSIIFHCNIESLKTRRFTRLIGGSILIASFYFLYSQEFLEPFGFGLCSAIGYLLLVSYLWGNASLEVRHDIIVRSEFSLNHSYVIRHVLSRILQLSPFIVITLYVCGTWTTLIPYVLWSLYFLTISIYDTISRTTTKTSIFWKRVEGRRSMTADRHIKKTDAKTASSW